MFKLKSKIVKCSFWLLAGILIFAAEAVTNAQLLDYQNKIDIVLEDGTHVILYGKVKSKSKEYTGEYYYLPVGLRLSKLPDGTPQFLFLKFTTDEKETVGGMQGGLIHFLMEWGLTIPQLAEAQTKLEQTIAKLAENRTSPYVNITAPKILGAAEVYVEDQSFRIISASLSDASSATLITSGSAPILPGSKAAVAGKLDKLTTQLLATTFEKDRSITDISLELNFKYDLIFPAVDGKITVDWSKFYSLFQSDSMKYSHTDRKHNRDTYSYDEVSRMYETCIENKTVNIEIDKNIVGNELADKIIEQFMNVMVESLTDDDMAAQPTAPTEEEKAEQPDIKQGRSYTFNRTKFQQKFEKKKEVYNLSLRLAIPKTFSITSNLGEWYNGVRDNKKCVDAVNLSSPFWQHRDINFILDLEAEDMFGKEVNYVTINVRKTRSDAATFEDKVTIDRDFLKNSGVKATMTYARGEDENPDVYEYKTQWSLVGGKVYPDNSPWIKGEWEGVTLTPPVKPRKIELEADIDELKDSDITRVTAQILYRKFGVTVVENIQLSTAKGEPIIEKTIYIDKDAKGYIYQLVFNHKTQGKLALDPVANVNDDYIYATIPDQLLNTESEIFKIAKEAGTEAMETVKDKLLDKFSDILGGDEDSQ